jgi:hypothetical protein
MGVVLRLAGYGLGEPPRNELLPFDRGGEEGRARGRAGGLGLVARVERRSTAMPSEPREC